MSKEYENIRIKTVQEITAEEVFSKEFALLKEDFKSQKQITWQVIVGVLVAFIVIVVTVAVQVFFSNKTDIQYSSNLQKDIYNQSLKVQDLNNRLDNLKIRNPYLK